MTTAWYGNNDQIERLANTAYEIDSSNLLSFIEALQSQIPSYFPRNMDKIMLGSSTTAQSIQTIQMALAFCTI